MDEIDISPLAAKFIIFTASKLSLIIKSLWQPPLITKSVFDLNGWLEEKIECYFIILQFKDVFSLAFDSSQRLQQSGDLVTFILELKTILVSRRLLVRSL